MRTVLIKIIREISSFFLYFKDFITLEDIDSLIVTKTYNELNVKFDTEDFNFLSYCHTSFPYSKNYSFGIKIYEGKIYQINNAMLVGDTGIIIKNNNILLESI